MAACRDGVIRIEQALPAFLAKISSARQLVVYYAGHAFTNDEKVVYLAPKDFALSRIDVTGIKLKWLVDELENRGIIGPAQSGGKNRQILLDDSDEKSNETDD